MPLVTTVEFSTLTSYIARCGRCSSHLTAISVEEVGVWAAEHVVDHERRDELAATIEGCVHPSPDPGTDITVAMAHADADGFRYALHNDHVYRIVNRGGDCEDTGLTAADVGMEGK